MQSNVAFHPAAKKTTSFYKSAKNYLLALKQRMKEHHISIPMEFCLRDFLLKGGGWR